MYGVCCSVPVGRLFIGLDGGSLLGESHIDVVGVSDVTRVFLFLRAAFALILDHLLRLDDLAGHLHREDVVDFDVMGGEAVVQERGGEEHRVSLVPKLGLILHIERQNIARVVEAETAKDGIGCDEPHEHAGIVQGRG